MEKERQWESIEETQQKIEILDNDNKAKLVSAIRLIVLICGDDVSAVYIKYISFFDLDIQPIPSGNKLIQGLYIDNNANLMVFSTNNNSSDGIYNNAFEENINALYMIYNELKRVYGVIYDMSIPYFGTLKPIDDEIE